MGLFKPDLYRNLALGFVLGAGLALWQVAPQLGDELAPQIASAFAPQAHAATIGAPSL